MDALRCPNRRRGAPAGGGEGGGDPPAASPHRRPAVSTDRAEGAGQAQEHPEGAQAIERALDVAVTMVIGEGDTGKTTLVTALANALVERGFRVAVLDADLGQSEIGPPTTIGLGRWTTPCARP